MLENLSTRDSAALVAGKVVERIREPAFEFAGQRLAVTTSVGVAFRSPTGGPIAAPDLLAQADAALYDAKAAGRNRFAVAVSPLHVPGAVPELK